MVWADNVKGLAAVLLLAGQPVLAQDVDPPAPSLRVDLNKIGDAQGGCRLTFVVENTLAAPVERLIYEAVLFDGAGKVDRLSLFDFGRVPNDRPRVRQFDLPGLECGSLGKLLINGPHACEAPGLDAGVCEDRLELSTKTDIEVMG